MLRGLPYRLAPVKSSSFKTSRTHGQMAAADKKPNKTGPGILLGSAMLLRALIGWLFGLAVTIILIFALFLALWRFIPPISTLMLARYVTFQPVNRTWIPLEQISAHLIATVISSEDARFCRHNGIDWNALDDQLSTDGGPSRGASTIAMQTAKNLFLWPHKSYLRKGLEIPLAMAIDLTWPKRRIIEVYLNIAEWGPNGLFGAEAAARHYFNRRALRLSARQAAIMATALPNPILRKIERPSRHHQRLARIISRRARNAGPWLDCLKP